MNHEPRCIEIPCTCVTILREKLFTLNIVLENMEAIISDLKRNLAKVEADKASNDADYLKCAAERNSLENKMFQMSCCCCNNCKHINDNIIKETLPEAFIP